MQKFSWRVVGLALMALLLGHDMAFAQERARRVAVTPPPSLWIEEMTSPEIREAIRQGYTNVLIPSAGIEQNGAHMPLNKHRLVVRATAQRIAEALGGTLIAPVIDFVPEGNIQSSEGHMAYAGTISIPRKVFADILDHTARSLHHHGFSQLFFIGDSGGNQLAQAMVARTLQNAKIQAYHIADYYADDRQEEELLRMGYDRGSIGGHAGLRDTSEVMAIAPEVLRRDRLALLREEDERQNGTWGDTTLATPELGKRLLQIKVEAAVAEICEKARPQPQGCRTSPQ